MLKSLVELSLYRSSVRRVSYAEQALNQAWEDQLEPFLPQWYDYLNSDCALSSRELDPSENVAMVFVLCNKNIGGTRRVKEMRIVTNDLNSTGQALSSLEPL